MSIKHLTPAQQTIYNKYLASKNSSSTKRSPTKPSSRPKSRPYNIDWIERVRAAKGNKANTNPNIRPINVIPTPSPTLPPATQLPHISTGPGRRTIKVSEPSWFFGWTDVPKWTVEPYDTYKLPGDGNIKVYADSEGGTWASSKGDKYYLHPDGSVLVKRASGSKLQYYAKGFSSDGAYGVTIKTMPEKFLE